MPSRSPPNWKGASSRVGECPALRSIGCRRHFRVLGLGVDRGGPWSASAGHAVARLAALPGDQPFELALDRLDRQMGGPIGCLRGLPAGQRWPEWPELNPQVGRDLALTVRTSEGEDS